ncbi:MAG: hypothetical protein WCS56_00445 [Bacilli bacterium]
MTILSQIQKQILSIGIIIIFIILIFLAIYWLRKSLKKNKNTKMLVLNMVIKYNVFINYVKFRLTNKEKILLYYVSIDNLNVLEKKYDNNIIHLYLRTVAKNLSICLPYGGKLAQTKQRDTFIICVPYYDIDPYAYGETLKNVVLERFSKNDIQIVKNVSVGYIDEFSGDLRKDLDCLKNALIQSKRSLGSIVKYTKESNASILDFKNIYEQINSTILNYQCFDIYKIALKQINEEYVMPTINNESYHLFFQKLPILDKSWANMWLIENLLYVYSDNNQGTKNINLPVYISSLENEAFIDCLQSMLITSLYTPEQIIISLKYSQFRNEQNIIKNLLLLKNIGFQISYKVEDIMPELYSIIQSYHINRLEINRELLENTNVEELLYFSKVNHLEVVLFNNVSTPIEQLGSGITHVAKLSGKLPVSEKKSRNRGNK